MCTSCSKLFSKCFLTEPRKADSEIIKEIFKNWDYSGDGKIAKEELKHVLGALNPSFADRDLNALMRVVDKNCSGTVEFNEFTDWLMAEEPLRIPDSFQQYLGGFMIEAGQAEKYSKRGINEVQVRPDGILFVTRGGDEQFMAKCCRSEEVQLTTFDGEEFIIQMECNESGLVIKTNIGRTAVLETEPLVFGPWTAPEGFHIVGLRTKPARTSASTESSGLPKHSPRMQFTPRSRVPATDRIVGARLSPLPAAAVYDPAASLLFISEQGYLLTLREVLAKGAVDVNAFGIGGVTPLMLAAQHGDTETMRMLMTSKANINACDAEGWTALRFAREYDNASAEEFLLRKGATEDGDRGAALSKSESCKHNSLARAELRKGFGAPKPNTFALEQVPQTADCKLKAPALVPAGGAFTGPVTVALIYGEVPKSKAELKKEAKAAQEAEREAEALKTATETPADTEAEGAASGPDAKGASTAAEKARLAKEKAAKLAAKAPPPADLQILYTTDGRDPYSAGKVYTGPITISSGDKVALRAVAISKSKRWRSRVVEGVFSICDYILPAEVLSGSLSAGIFPEAEGALKDALADVLDTPKEQIAFKANAGAVTDERWITLAVHNPKPKQRLHLDQKFATIRKNEKLAKQFLEKVLKDISHKKVCNVKPENPNLVECEKNIAVDFTLPKDKIDELENQLRSLESFLINSGKLKALWSTARLEAQDVLGDRLNSIELRNELKFSLGKKAPTEVVAGMGEGNKGTVAFKVASAKDGKKLKTNVGKAIKETLPTVEAADPKESPGIREFDYFIDVVKSPHMNGHQVVEQMEGNELLTELAEKLEKVVPATVELTSRVECQKLKKVECHFSWRKKPIGVTEAEPIQDRPDIACFVYSRSKLMAVVDTKSAVGQQIPGKVSRTFTNVDILADSKGAFYVSVNVADMASQVTELYFSLTAFESDDLQMFLEPTIKLCDSATGREIAKCVAPPYNGPTKSTMMCALSLTHTGSWVLRMVGVHNEGGNLRDTAPLERIVGARQASFDRWNRRSPIVKLRVLHRVKWLSRSSSSQFAKLLWHILELPLPVFQVLVSWL